MSDRWNKAVGLLAIVSVLVLVPASAALLRDSVEGRRAIAALRTPYAWQVRETQILNSVLDNPQQRKQQTFARGLQILSIVSNRTEAEDVLRVWNAVKTDPLVSRIGTDVFLAAIIDAGAPEAMLADLSVNRIRDPEQFSARTGIRVLPFSLVVAGGDHVLAAGPGLPDASFILDAAERFVADGPDTAVKFRVLTPELNARLTAIETLFPSGTALR